MFHQRHFLFGLACLALYLLLSLTASRSVSAQDPPVLTPRVHLPLLMGKWTSGPPPPSLFGVSDSHELALAFSPQALRLAVTAGVSANRVSVSWASIEPFNTTPENFDWSSSDTLLLPLIKQGLQPQVLILSNPSWAANTRCGPLNDPNDLVGLMTALGTRYPQITYWALYNEVDLTTYSRSGRHNGGCFGESDLNHNNLPDYADYAELMRVARRALHSANPQAKLVMGPLAYDNFDPADSPPNYPGGCCFGYSFLDHLLAYMRDHPLPSGEQYADVLGFNNYKLYDKAYWEKYNPGDGVSSKVAALNTVQNKYGFAFPLLVSELSSGTTSPDRPDSYHEQARDLSRLYVQSAMSGLEQSTWWVFADFSANCGSAALDAAHPNLRRILANESNLQAVTANPTAASACSDWTYGIVDQSLNPKPSYYAFKTVAEELRNWSPVSYVLTQGLYSYFFIKDGHEKRVYYNKDGVLRTVAIDASAVRVVDMYGNAAYLTPDSNGKFQVTVGLDPVFVELDPLPNPKRPFLCHCECDGFCRNEAISLGNGFASPLAMSFKNTSNKLVIAFTSVILAPQSFHGTSYCCLIPGGARAGAGIGAAEHSCAPRSPFDYHARARVNLSRGHSPLGWSRRTASLRIRPPLE